ncbi:MAG: hypothetical protein K6T86_10650 [Pirellulales bacterium]|nr:hypothetical protein [Pirellulales bacterium]
MMSGPGRAPTDPFAPRRRLRVQFRLSTLLAAMVLFTIVAWVLGGLLRESQPRHGPSHLPLYVVLTIAAPVLVMVMLNLASIVRQRLVRRRAAHRGTRAEEE